MTRFKGTLIYEFITVRQKSFLQNFKQEEIFLMNRRLLAIDGDSHNCVLVDGGNVKKFLS